MGLFDLFRKAQTQSLADEYRSSRANDTNMDFQTHYESAASNNQATTSSYAQQQYSLLIHIEDVFYITGRGVVATGKIETGTVNKGDSVTILTGTDTISAKIKAIEMFRKVLDSAHAGDNVGLMLEGVQRGEIASGDTIVKM